MATIALKPAVHRGNLSAHGATMLVIGDSVNGVGNKEANSQVYKKGEFVQRNSAGAVIRAASLVGDKIDVSLVSSNKDNKLYGIALKDGSNVTSNHPYAPVAFLKPGDLIEVNLVDGADGDAPTNYVLAATDIGRMVALLFDDTRDQWYATVNAAEECAMVYGFPGSPGDTLLGGVGDTNARVTITLCAEVTKLGCLATVA